jgi:antitoxin component YwqK of YwqJK toxin-antitoxin module
VNDKEDGFERAYYSNGQLKSEVFYINGSREGFYKEYYENAALKYESFFVNDVEKGIIKKYSENGALIHTTDIDKLESILQECERLISDIRNISKNIEVR